MSAARLLLALALVQSTSVQPTPPPAREIADGTYLVDGAMLEGRGPDGNTVILKAPKGLVVIDTGRHPWHSDAIVAFAREKRAPVSVIVNTHWHLDHSSGNRRVKGAFLDAKTYTSRAVDRALAPGGFLVRSLAATRERPLDANASATRREERGLFEATMEAADTRRPDVAIERSATMDLAGRQLSVRLARSAVTDADVWIYDERTRVAVLGDLVTLPAPFFETACPAKWQAALDEVWATPFRLAVPGHGAPMTRAGFDTYRQAFGRFRACAAGDGAASACADTWTRDIGPLLASDDDRRHASEYAAYYVDFLRKGGGASADCLAK